jgi:hypothetical protein
MPNAEWQMTVNHEWRNAEQYYSPFPIRHFRFAISDSPFPIRHFRFAISDSPFPIRHFPFVIDHN